MNTQLREEFEQILADVVKINGLPIEQAVPVATAIFVESGKFKRTEMLSGSRQYSIGNGSNGNEPATDKQLAALKSFKIPFKEGITKAEASQLLDEPMQRMKARNGK